MTTRNSIITLIDKLRMEIRNEELSFGDMLPTERELAKKMKVSRPTIAKVYNTLQSEGLIRKKAGAGTMVIFNKNIKQYLFGLLLPGSGESEIFGIINDRFLEMENERNFTFLWDGAVANDASMRQSFILRNCQSYIEKKVDGILFSPLERTQNMNRINEKISKLFDAHKIPMILIDRDIYSFPNRSKHDLVSLDNFHAGYVMTNCLIKEGCERIHFFYRKNSAYSVNMRYAGCRSACFDAGISCDDIYDSCGEPSDSDLVSKLSVNHKKTGILCGNDSTAAVLMSTFSKVSIKVSKDVLIAGFDDMKYARHLQVPLTTYRQPLLEIARISIEMMLSRLSNPNMPTRSISLIGKVIERDSTKFV